MAMVAGEMVYIEYMGYPGVVHARLLLSLVQDSEWVILTPDLDCYCEDLRPDNPDFSLFFHIPDGSLPPGIPVQQVYSFRPMTAREYSLYMQQGRNERDAELLQRGLPIPVVGGGAGAAPVGVGGQAPHADVPGVEDGGNGTMWVLAEMVEGHKIGEQVRVPANMPTVNDHGLFSIQDSSGQQRAVLVKRVPPEDLSSFCDARIKLARSSESLQGEDQVAAEDVRTMSVQYNANGERMRGFKDSIGEMVQCSFEDFPLEPPTCLEYLRAVGTISESCYGQHLAWVQQAKIPDSNRAIHEDELLARVLDACIMYDCLNPANLACMELIARRRQLIAQAHSLNPSVPSYDGADLFLGNQYRAGGGIVVPALRDHVSKGMQAESQILKERRKLAENRGAGRGSNQPPKGDGKGRGGGQASG